MKALLVFSFLFSALGSAHPSSDNIARLEVPGVKGVLQLVVGASPWYLDVMPEDRWAMLHARQRPDRIMITALVRQVPFAATSESCKADLWPKMKQEVFTKTEDLRESSGGGVSHVEYTFKGAQDTKSRHLLAYWGAGNLCAEVHLVKANFTQQDEKAFEQVISSVRMDANKSGLKGSEEGTENSSVLMAEGTELYAQANYGRALPFYQDAFDLERKTRTFDKDLFLDLTSRLAFCYRLSGNLVKARETLEYGLLQDPEYPLFHYDMACVEAQMGKMDETLGQLREAYKYRRNASPGQMPPDPTEDSCFQKFANDPRFATTVEKLLRQ